MSRQYLSYEESVSMLRKALRHNFPGVKFSVAKSYQRGTTVRVRYEYGPTVEKVDRVAQRFRGADFDGMTDSTSYPSSLLVNQAGDVREVSHGLHFVFVERDIPQAYFDATVAKLGESWTPEQWASYPDYERERIARGGLCKLDLRADEPLASVAERAIAAIFGREASNA